MNRQSDALRDSDHSIGQPQTNGRAERSIGTTMEIHQLRYFVAVAEEGSFSNAAEREHVSQPSLSQQIHKLEEESAVVRSAAAPAKTHGAIVRILS